MYQKHIHFFIENVVTKSMRVGHQSYHFGFNYLNQWSLFYMDPYPIQHIFQGDIYSYLYAVDF